MRTVRITFYALCLCAFAVAVVFLVREYRKTERLDAVCGVWIAADNRSTLRIERYGRKHLIVVKRLDGKHVTNFSTGAVSVIGTPRAGASICSLRLARMRC